jgi:hypothetical protein
LSERIMKMFSSLVLWNDQHRKIEDRSCNIQLIE